MAYQKCPKCQGAGKIKIEEPVTSDTMGEVEKECDLCDGIGYLEEDLTPQIVEALKVVNERLDKIIEILNKTTGG